MGDRFIIGQKDMNEYQLHNLNSVKEWCELFKAENLKQILNKYNWVELNTYNRDHNSFVCVKCGEKIGMGILNKFGPLNPTCPKCRYNGDNYYSFKKEWGEKND